jgi:hypothetical protein
MWMLTETFFEALPKLRTLILHVARQAPVNDRVHYCQAGSRSHGMA